MRLLALDTSTEGCSAALLSGEALFWRSEEPGRGHADRILQMIDEVLKEGGASLGTLDAIGACVGPGAFTGVRISVATAQGLAFGAGLKVIPVQSLEALAYGAILRGARRVFACLDARMNEVYFACYRQDPHRGLIACAPAALGNPDAVALPADAVEHGGAYLGIGRGLAAYPQLLTLAGVEREAGGERALPDARAIARLAALRLAAGGAIEPDELSPLYLRDNVALTEAERGVR